MVTNVSRASRTFVCSFVRFDMCQLSDMPTLIPLLAVYRNCFHHSCHQTLSLFQSPTHQDACRRNQLHLRFQFFYPRSHSSTKCDMSHQSQSSQLQMAFEAAIQEYAKRTGVALVEHPLTKQLRNCDSVDSITSALQQVGALSRFRESHKVTKPIKNIVSVLYRISTVTNLDQVVGPVCRTC
jgi:hypothetical protein